MDVEWDFGEENPAAKEAFQHEILRTIDAVSQYEEHFLHACVTLRQTAFSLLPDAHRELLSSYPFSYLDTLKSIEKAIKTNAEVARAVGYRALEMYQDYLPENIEEKLGPDLKVPLELLPGSKSHADLNWVRYSLRVLYRDWASEASAEREACYGPVKQELANEYVRRCRLAEEGITHEDAVADALIQLKTQGRIKKNKPNGKKKTGETAVDSDHKSSYPGSGGQEAEQHAPHSSLAPSVRPLGVLVPGSGVGRLLVELSFDGHAVQGCEIDRLQIMLCALMLNGVESVGQFTIYPWADVPNNNLKRAHQLAAYQIPDIHVPSECAQKSSGLTLDVAGYPWQGEMQVAEGDFLELYSQDTMADSFDAVVSVFFLDTAVNVVNYLYTLCHVLRRGGVLINLGPLMWQCQGDKFAENQEDSTAGKSEKQDDCSAHRLEKQESSGTCELTDDEVINLVEKMGFVVEMRRNKMRAPFIHNPESMIEEVYRASFWVARKIVDRPPERFKFRASSKVENRKATATDVQEHEQKPHEHDIMQEQLREEQLREEQLREDELREQKRVEKERVEKERVEKERVEKERVEKERVEKERAEKERAEKEKAAKERLQSERLKKEQLERERLERERHEKELLEKELREEARLKEERRIKAQHEKEIRDKIKAEEKERKRKQLEEKKAQKQQRELERRQKAWEAQELQVKAERQKALEAQKKREKEQREREEREKEKQRREQMEKQQREKQQREREERLREEREKKEQQERAERQRKEQREKEQREKEAQKKEQQEKERREQELREQEQCKKDQRKKEQQEKGRREKINREKEQRKKEQQLERTKRVQQRNEQKPHKREQYEKVLRGRRETQDLGLLSLQQGLHAQEATTAELTA